MQNMGGFAGGGPGNLQQGNADAQNNQIMRFIVHSLQQQQQQQPPPTGWRAQVKTQERMHWIKQVYVAPSTRAGEYENTDEGIHKY